MKSKKKVEVLIPLELARILACEDEDFKEDTQVEDVRALARSMLRLLLKASNL